jgi:trk system potassium uptake protein TrkA
MEHFAKGRALLVEIVLDKDCKLLGESLFSMGKKLKTRVLVCAVQRGEEIIIPSGTFMFHEGDRVHFTSDANSLRDFLAEINLEKAPFKDIMIIGEGKIPFYLAKELSEKKYNIKIVVPNKTTAEEFAEELPRATVVLGNGTQHDLLIEEGIEAMDAFVALTDIDEENMIVSMFANKLNVKKTITQIKSDDLYDMLSELGIENNVSPKHIVANKIISYIRALANKRGSNILNLYRLVNNQVEALEFSAKKKEKFIDKPLKTLRTKQNCLIACIIRENEVIIPDGNSTIALGDNVIVVTTHKNFDDLTDIFD